MRTRALRPQSLALLDTEAVLLVDHDESEVGERRLLPQQGVGPDHDQRLPGRDPQGGLAALGRGHLTSQQRRHQQRREIGTEHLGDRAQMLTGQDLCGGDQRGLAAALGHLQHRPEGHQRLAGSDFTLNETVHRPGTDEVSGDLPSHRLLIGSERVREARVEAFQQPARARRPRRGGERTNRIPLLEERRLKGERLMHAQGAHGRVYVVPGAGAVHQFESSRAVSSSSRSRISAVNGSGASARSSSTRPMSLAICQVWIVEVAG